MASIPLSQTGLFKRQQRLFQQSGPMSTNFGPVGAQSRELPSQLNRQLSGGGSVLGASTGPSAPGGGGPGATLTQNGALNPPAELLLQQPSSGPFLPDNSAALAALSQREAGIGEARGLANQQIETAAGQARTTVEQGRDRQLGELGQQETREKGRGESAIAEARRQASELQQGIQSRFGGTTGTGAFAGEILGAESLRNIQANRQALNQTLTQIEGEKQNVEKEASTRLEQIEQQRQLDIERSRQFFEQQLTEIAGLRGELESRKSELRTQALQEHQRRLDEVNANNTNFKRQLFSQYQEQQQKLDAFAKQQVGQFEASLTPAQFLEAVRLGADTGSFPEGAVPGTLQGVRFSSAEEEELDPLQQLQSLAGI